MSSLSARGRVSTKGRRVAAVHRQDNWWRVVVAENDGQVGKVVAHVTINAGDAAALKNELDQQNVEHLIHVLPGGATLCRVIELPNASDQELLQAVALQAEAQLPSNIPPHRRGAGLIDAGAPAGHRAVLVTGWAGESDAAVIGLDDETWTSEAAALSLLLAGRNQAMAAYADRESGSLTVVASSGQRTAFRTVREDGSDRDAWNRAVETTLTETAMRAGLNGSIIETHSGSGAQALLLDPTARRRLSQLVAGDSAFMQQHGVAALAAVGFCSATALNEGLFELTKNPRVPRRSMPERFARWIAKPSHAYGVLIATLLIALFVPMALAYARKEVLSNKLARIEGDAETQKALAAVDTRVAVYRELEQRRWPMTKLLADLSQLMPVGTELESVQMGGAERFIIRGYADSFDLVSKLQSQLNGSNVFDDVSIDKSGPGSSDTKRAVQFDISGRVVRPFSDAKGAEDFTGDKRLAKRLYGERAELAENALKEKATATTQGGNGRNGSSRDIFDRAGGDSSKAEPIPEALTDDAIKKMDRNKAGAEMGSRRKAASRPDVDASTKERLRGEVDKLRARLRELQGGS